MQQNMFQMSGIDQVIPVDGIEGAKSYPMGVNCRAPLFDKNEDVFYIKKTDANGFPEIKRYRFEEEVIMDNNSETAISLNDIRAIIREELSNVQQSISTTNNSTNDNPETGDYSTAKPTNYKPKYNNSKQSKPNSSVVANGEKQQ